MRYLDALTHMAAPATSPYLYTHTPLTDPEAAAPEVGGRGRQPLNSGQGPAGSVLVVALP